MIRIAITQSRLRGDCGYAQLGSCCAGSRRTLTILLRWRASWLWVGAIRKGVNARRAGGFPGESRTSIGDGVARLSVPKRAQIGVDRQEIPIPHAVIGRPGHDEKHRSRRAD
jgi:hypothetical protein